FLTEGARPLNSIFSYFRNMDWAGVVGLLLQVAGVLICLTVHEVSHGAAAYALGDPTAKSQHRLSLNPLRHLDLFGTLMMLMAGFGWAKPVPVDMRYFKHPKSGMAITALAGPVSNFVLAYLALLAVHIFDPFLNGGALWAGTAVRFLLSLASLSLGLGIFNLIPFPPLDGSKVLGAFLPDRMYYTILRYERIGMFILMGLLYFNVLDGVLFYARGTVLNFLLRCSGWG
ncbi:MAG: site-2 protease family protein, partial [Pseudoflavonifractor sp.]